MKHTILVNHTILALTLLAIGLPATAATITLVPSVLNPSTGQNFSVNVVANDNGTDELVAFGFNVLTSSAGSASFLGALLNPLFTGIEVPGTTVAALTDGFSNAVGSTVTLATLQFLAGPDSGPLTISIFSDLNNPNEGLFGLDSTFASFVQTTNASVDLQVVESPTIPEPGTLSLLAIASAGLLVFARSNRTRH
ncbi:MAG: PEP-CTERM sorting domain-containing protein [Bryobacteraceae bacterium]|nr:PEP-CTERM sorting domain-containing protein [Bryobacteraceae bacterium]